MSHPVAVRVPFAAILAERRGFRAAAGANPALRRLELASMLWAGAEYVYLIGLLVFAYAVGGTGAVALVAILQAAPSVVLLPVIIRATERMPRDTLLRGTLVVRLTTIGLAAGALLATGWPALVFGLAAVDAVASGFLRPIRGSLIPMLARTPGELVASNVVLSTGTSLAGLMGPALAAVLLAVAGPPATFVAATVIAGAAALVATGIRRSQSGPPAGTGPAPVVSSRGPARESGPDALRRLPHARVVIGLIVGQRFVRGMLSVLIVALAVELLQAGDQGVGILNAAIGLGGLAGGIASILLVRARRLAGPFLGALALWGAALVAPALLPSIAAAVVMLAVGGVGKAVLEVAGSSLLQRTIPTASRSAVLGIMESLVTAALALGAVAGALLVDTVGAAGALVAAGLLPVLLAVGAWPALRTADDAAVVPERELTLLRHVSMFRPLQLTALEELANALARVDVRAGTEITRQGESGDRFYIVEQGRFETRIDGRPVGELGAGDSFGEIALLRDVPRTATVVAIEPGVLGVLPRDAFLAAVTGRHEASAVAEEVVRGRLGG
jgi:hypothetical protein